MNTTIPVTNNPLIPVLSVEEIFRPEKLYALMKTVPKGLAVFIMAAIVIYFKAYAGLILLAFPLAIAVYNFYLIRSEKYYLTAQQLIVEKGVFTKCVNYLELYRVKDIVVHQSFFQKIFDMMTITVLSFDSIEKTLVINGVRVSDIAQKIRNRVQECRRNNKVLSMDNYPSPF
jgi:uncharacterized membrane protein YdbT with pleckstrin-like domain